MTEETCREVRALLSELLEGELTPDARARTLDHLRGCDACRAELAALERTIEALHALPREEPPPDLLARIESTLGAGRAGSPAHARGRFRFRRHAVAMLLAVGILVGIIRVLPHGPYPLHAPRTAVPLGRMKSDRAAPKVPREAGADKGLSPEVPREAGADKDLSAELEKRAVPVDRLSERNREARQETDLRDARRDGATGASGDQKAMNAEPAAPVPAAPAESAGRQAFQKKAEAFATRQNAPAIAANEVAGAPAPDPSRLFASPRPEQAWADSVLDGLLHRRAEAAAAWRRLTDAQRAAVLDAWARASHPPGARAELDSALSREENPETASMLRAFRARAP